MLALALVINVSAILLSAITFGAYLARRIAVSKALAYSCFVFIGAAVARFQYALIVEDDGDTLGFYQFATIVLVIVLFVTALIASRHILKKEKPLQLMIVLTLILAIFQFGGIAYVFLNWYARTYALICIMIPVLVLALNWAGGRARPFSES